MAYEVFISFKRNALDGSGVTRDFQLAADLHRTLKAAGVEVFFSEKDLSTSAFIREIYRALDEAKIQIVVGTKPEYVTSEWVHAEWETFLGAILGGRKKHAHIYTYLEGMTANELPLALYSSQSYDSTQKAKLVTRILKNLGKTVPKPQPVPEPQPVFYKNLRVGSRIPFGKYPQGANGEVESLMWRVLAVESDRALLITEKLIDCVQYNEKYTDVTWETCTLRRWMNNDFIFNAFNIAEYQKLATVTRTSKTIDMADVKVTQSTSDRIFALSIDEAKKYFSNDNDRMAAPTGYAKKQGCYVSEYFSLPTGEKTGWWWLRSPGNDSLNAAGVLDYGDFNRGGNRVNLGNGCVRPAFWLNL